MMSQLIQLKRSILHIYDLDSCVMRPYEYPNYLVKYIGYSKNQFQHTHANTFMSHLKTREIWTFEITTEKSPRFRQWLYNDDWLKGAYWIPPAEFLLTGFQPKIEHHFVYQIKLHHHKSASDVYVSSDHIDNLRLFTSLGVHIT
jgi:hypothetical protein